MTSVAAGTSPFHSRTFRSLWVATIVSNIGTWMHDVGAGWLMTSLSPEPLMVALVQSATTLPMFLLALPAGALADIVDRRLLLIGAQCWVALAASLLALSSFAGVVTPFLLLAFTFLLACGAALSAPAFQAIVPELVERPALVQAISLNSLGINIARAIGPALGGVLIALAGVEAVFALNALSILGVIVVLKAWRRSVPPRRLPAEHFPGALGAVVRYARHAPELQRVLLRSAGFFLFASALWALLPLLGRHMLGLRPAEYGGLLAFLGAGAVGGALILPMMRRHLPTNLLTLAASILFMCAAALLGLAGNFAGAAALMAVAGIAWIAMLSSFNAAAQAAAPAWVKARSLALFLLVFQGSLTAGSALWGALAGELGIPTVLILASCGGTVVAALLAWRAPLGAAGAADLTPSLHWPSPVTADQVDDERGPVMVTIEYAIAPEKVDDFARAMAPLGELRRRDGALAWGLYEDAVRPGAMIESFVLKSWLEHLRQHERPTHADLAPESAARAYHLGPGPPLVRHWLAP